MKTRCIPCLLSGVAIGIAVLFGIYLYTTSLEESEPSVIIDESISMAELTLLSSAFEHNGKIPSRYTCDGDNLSPPLVISGADTGVKSFVLIMDDPDIPEEVKKARVIEVFDHWIVFNLSPDTTEIKEGSSKEEALGIHGTNSTGNAEYTGPCPPGQFEPTEHRYVFALYSLDMELELPEGATKEQVKDAMRGHILQKAELIGLYERIK